MISTILLIVFMVVFSQMYQDNINDKERILAEDFGYFLHNEFILASEAKPGYIRKFNMPYNLEGFSYDAYIINTVLIINFTDGEIPYNIPETKGQLILGAINTIQNINNSICLNSNC